MNRTATVLHWLAQHWLALLGTAIAGCSLYAHFVYSAYHWTDARRSSAGHDASLVLSIMAIIVSVPALVIANRRKKESKIESTALGLSVFALVVRLCVMS